METLLEKLQNNTEAINFLTNQYLDIEKAEFYRVFSTEHMRKARLEWNLKVKDRVLRMRKSLLIKLQNETIKELEILNNKLKKAA